MTPTLLAVGAGGPICFIPSSLKDERAKDNFASIARLICVAHATTAAVMIIEAWMKTASPDGTLDLTVPPSQSLHRREVVALTGESQAGYRQKILQIIRTGAGGFFGFGEFTTPPETTFSGRFAQILPPKVPTSAEQKKAAALLAVLGVTARGCGAIGRRTETAVFAEDLRALGDGHAVYNSAQKASRLTPDWAIRPARVPGLIGRCIGTTTVRCSRRRITWEPVSAFDKAESAQGAHGFRAGNIAEQFHATARTGSCVKWRRTRAGAVPGPK